MTSRAEYRILLRQDNADFRLTQKGYDCGLVTKERYERFLKRKREVSEIRDRLDERLSPKDALPFLEKYGYEKLSGGISYTDMIRRGIPLKDIMKEFSILGEYAFDTIETAEVEVKYEGYLKQGMEQIERAKKM